MELDIVKVCASLERRMMPNSRFYPTQAFHHEIRFQIELANEHREFISGKKNGKINKIMLEVSPMK